MRAPDRFQIIPSHPESDWRRIAKSRPQRVETNHEQYFPLKDIPKGFLNKLGEMHTAEEKLALALPLIIKAAKAKDLKTLLQVHLQETKGHARALEQTAESLGEKLPEKKAANR